MKYRTWRDIAVALLSGIGSALFVFLLGGGLIGLGGSLGPPNFDIQSFTEPEKTVLLIVLVIASVGFGTWMFLREWRRRRNREP